MSDREALLTRIRNSVIGDRIPLITPFGERPLIYADYTASGRALTFIEDIIRHQVLPWYANTHTETSATGRQISAFREQARTAVRKSINAGEEHAVIFCGAGATAAVNRLVDYLGLRAGACARFGMQALEIPQVQRPVVFIGPFEHHSNDLPWRESVAEVVTIALDDHGGIDLNALQQALDQYADRPLKIGSFSAASNVTGIRTDIDAVTQLLHDNGALAFCDYAAAAPYLAIDLQAHSPSANSREDASYTSLDALFLSPHKFVGGPGTPGILVVKKSLLPKRQPAVPGGGTVSWVSAKRHTYLPAGERREEAGTPAIIESIRVGLVFALKDQVGAKAIENLECHWLQRAFTCWGDNPNIEILGGVHQPRISIVSLQILRHGKPLHHGLVVALLNDLFGIQVRGGCSCAGPYGHQLLNLSDRQSAALEQVVAAGESILKPGWVRLNFNYFFDQETVDYLISAVELLAELGHQLQPYYQYDVSSGIWRYQGVQGQPILQLSLNAIQEESILGRLNTPLQNYIVKARTIISNPPGKLCPQPQLSDKGESLRWFYL